MKYYLNLNQVDETGREMILGPFPTLHHLVARMQIFVGISDKWHVMVSTGDKGVTFMPQPQYKLRELN